VMMLLQNTVNQQYIHKAMMMSAGLFTLYRVEDLTPAGDGVMQALCNSTQMACLRGIPASVLVGLQWPSIPVIDRQTLTEQPIASLVYGRSIPVPMIFGSVGNESQWLAWLLLGGSGQTQPPIDVVAYNTLLGTMAALLPFPSAANYTNWYQSLAQSSGYATAFYRAANDSVFTCGVNFAADYNPNRIWRYNFIHTPSQWFFSFIGVTHQADLAYVFGRPLFGELFTAPELQLSKDMRAYVDNFHRNADPNKSGLPNWPIYTRGGSQNTIAFEVGGNYQLLASPLAANPALSSTCGNYQKGWAITSLPSTSYASAVVVPAAALWSLLLLVLLAVV